LQHIIASCTHQTFHRRTKGIGKLIDSLSEESSEIRGWAAYLPAISPAALMEPDTEASIIVNLVVQEQGSDALRILRQRCYGRQEPAVAKAPLQQTKTTSQ
jgi:hypothetical protein